jgi:hypothetical protein
MSDKPPRWLPGDISEFQLTTGFFDSILYDIHHCKKRTKEVLAYHDSYHAVLAHQRSQIIEELKLSLARRGESFKFEAWSRIVSYQYSNHPLSAKGSVLNDPGGRFNIGVINPMRYPPFPALYVAADFPTAFKEVFGQAGTIELSEAEMALANEAAITKVVVAGQIEQVLNVKSKSALREFVGLIKDFRLPPSLLKQARKLKLHLPQIIKDVEKLQTVLSSPDWRNMPQLVDTPAPCQIFGQIAHAAGIEAILYRSVKTRKDCLAVFVENFQNSSSFVELEGALPKATKHTRLDSTSWQYFVR